MVKLNAKDYHLVCRFRRNARESLTSASRKTGIPVSTIYDKLQKYEGSLIKKHTMILDYSKLGYNVKVLSIIKVHKEDRAALQGMLENHQNVNSVYKASSGQDFIVEGIFKNLLDFSKFVDSIDNHRIIERKEYYVISDIKQEGFLTNEALIDTV